MNYKNIEKKRKKAITNSDKKLEKWTNLINKRRLIFTSIIFLALLVGVLGFMFGSLNADVRIEYVDVVHTTKVIREVCPVFNPANATIVTGDTMKEKVIIIN